VAISRERKEQLIAGYVEMLQKSDGVVITEYRAMKMDSFNSVRKSLREVNASYVVTKNRLFKLALNEVGFAVPQDLLKGTVAVAIAEGNLPGMVKVLLDKTKEQQDKLVLKGGILQQSIFSEKDLEAISTMPSLDEIRSGIAGLLVQPLSQLLGLFVAPQEGLVGTIDAGSKTLVNVLAAYVAKQESDSAA